MSVIECVLLAICPVFILWNGWNYIWNHWGQGFLWRLFPWDFHKASYTAQYLIFAIVMFAFFWFGTGLEVR